MEIEFKKDEATSWFARGNNFSVEIKHWAYPNYRGGIQNNWNVYAHIWFGHPLFERLSKRAERGFVAEHEFPIGNGGATLCKLITEDDSAIEPFRQLKIGNDYAHIYNEFEAECGADRMPHSVRENATEVFEYLQLHDCEPKRCRWLHDIEKERIEAKKAIDAELGTA